MRGIVLGAKRLAEGEDLDSLAALKDLDKLVRLEDSDSLGELEDLGRQMAS